MALLSPRLNLDPTLVKASNNAPPMRLFENQGQSVIRIQALLEEFGFALPISRKGGGYDGIYGGETAGVVMQFQNLYGLKADGQVGRDTLATMDGILMGTVTRRIVLPVIELTDDDPKKLALAAIPQARIWVDSALAWLAWIRLWLDDPSKKDKFLSPQVRAAMEVHFHFIFEGPYLNLGQSQRDWLSLIMDNYQKVQASFSSADSFFENGTEKDCVTELGANPACTSFRKYVRFTPDFVNYGEKCRAAMVLHECVHYVDPTSPDKAYEHEKSKYAALTTDEAIHNPSSYAAFGQNATAPFQDLRYGAGRPKD